MITDMNSLQSNLDLLAYMRTLAAELEALDVQKDARCVIDASKFASGSLSEFLHEARIALARVLRLHEKDLPTKQTEDLRSVIRQIDDAFRRIGGA